MKPQTLINLQESVTPSYRFGRGGLKFLLENIDPLGPGRPHRGYSEEKEEEEGPLDIILKNSIAGLATPPKMVAPSLLGVQSQLGWTPDAAKKYRQHYKETIGSLPGFLASLGGAAGAGKAAGALGGLISRIPGIGAAKAVGKVLGPAAEAVGGPLLSYGGGVVDGATDTAADLLTRAFLDPRAGSR